MYISYVILDVIVCKVIILIGTPFIIFWIGELFLVTARTIPSYVVTFMAESCIIIIIIKYKIL